MIVNNLLGRTFKKNTLLVGFGGWFSICIFFFGNLTEIEQSAKDKIGIQDKHYSQ